MIKIAEIHSTYPDKPSAENTAQYLVHSRLIACANVIPAKSYFDWDGMNQADEEWLVIMKTMPVKIDLVVAAVQSTHPYQLPAITWTDVYTTDAYGTWVKDQTTLSAQ